MILTFTQLAHLYRNLKQKIFLPEVGIIGGYHGGNLGDMALGMSVSNVLKTKNIPYGLQTIYNLEKWPKTEFAIIGGGAVGYIDSLTKVYDRYKDDFSVLGFLGVDFNEIKYPDYILTMLKQASFVSCRSSQQAEKMKRLTGRMDIIYHPDIAFSLLPKFCKDSKNINKEKLMLVNVLPLYGNMKDDKIIPNVNFKEERPELYENFQVMHVNYKNAIRMAVKEALSAGYQIECASFTPLDRQYCRSILIDFPVAYPAYHSDPIKMIKRISIAEKFICTRFHATIFGLKVGAEIQPIAYATKNEIMLNELGLNPEDYVSSRTFVEGKISLPKSFLGDSKILNKWEMDSTNMIEKCIDSVIKKSSKF